MSPLQYRQQSALGHGKSQWSRGHCLLVVGLGIMLIHYQAEAWLTGLSSWQHSAEARRDLRLPLGHRSGQSRLPLKAVMDQTSSPMLLKERLYMLCSTLNRGLGATADEKRMVMELVEALEESVSSSTLNETDVKGEQQLQQAVPGRWSVIFTTTPDLLSLDRLPLPGWRTGRIGQAFDDDGAARNEITFLSPLNSRIEQVVKCSWKVVEEGSGAGRVSLTFLGSSTRLEEVMGFEPPVSQNLDLPLPEVAGIFKVSYLDSDLMVQRTRAGGAGVNILLKVDGW